MDRTSTTDATAVAAWRMPVAGVAAVVLAIAVASIVPGITPVFRVVVAAVTATIAAFAALIALAAHAARDDKAFLMLGVGLLGTAVLGSFHFVGTAAVTADWAGLVSRTWLATMMYASWRASQPTAILQRRSDWSIWVTAAVVIGAILFVLGVVPLPHVVDARFLLHRPGELIPATFFALTLAGHAFRGDWRRNRLARLITVAMMFACVSEFLLAFVSSTSSDSMFGAAIVLQAAVVALVAFGLITVAGESFLERRVLETQYRRKAVELANAREGLEAFVRSASHDLKAPLRHIYGFSKFIRDAAAERLSEDEITDLERVMGAASHMSELLESLLRFARLGAPSLRHETCPLNELVETVIAQLPVDQQSRVVFDGLSEVRGDRALLTIVLQNLIENGLKYVNDDDSIVTITSRSTPSETTVSVDDNGIGVATRHVSRIFEPGARGVSDSEFEGTGFGLATCARIILAHEGRIWVEPKPDRGSTFHFTVPA